MEQNRPSRPKASQANAFLLSNALSLSLSPPLCFSANSIQPQIGIDNDKEEEDEEKFNMMNEPLPHSAIHAYVMLI